MGTLCRRAHHRTAPLLLSGLLGLALLHAMPAAAAGASKVSDFRTTPALTQVSDPVVVGSRLHFIADDGVRGPELWLSDGSRGGTVLVKEIHPGPRGSMNPLASTLTKVGSSVYFSASTGGSGAPVLWKTDGTAAGTVPLGTVNPASLTDVGGVLYFSAFLEGSEPFISDGTPGGTRRIADIYGFYAIPEPICCGRQYFSSDPAGFTAVNGTVLFAATRGDVGRELWKTDGTEAGTTLVKDLVPGSAGSSPRRFAVLGNALFFLATDAGGPVGLWRSDGTGNGTVLVKSILPSSASESNLFVHGGALYFVAADAAGVELWKSDGSTPGTVRVKDINPGAGDSGARRFTSLGGTLFFVADDGASGRELWKTDGTEAGTVRVKDINPGAAASDPKRLTVFGGALHFVADDGTGLALWRSDGTEAGTVKVVPGFPAPGFPEAGAFAILGSQMYFAAADPAGGTELWRSDGTPGGTAMVRDVNPGAGSVGLGGLVAVGNTVYFSVDEGTGGVELWKSDGTAAGTSRVRDIQPGATGSDPYFLTNLDGKLLFAAAGTASGVVGADGFEPWTSNGTEAGTGIVAAINQNTFSSDRSPDLSRFTVVNGRAFFSGHDALVPGGDELVATDGTSAGTAFVKDINPTGSSSPHNMAKVDGLVYFAADDGTSGIELWKSDGTAAGTVRVKDINPGAAGSGPRNLVGVNGVLFFAADDGTSGVELWKSDGTEAGTVRVKDIRAGSQGSDPAHLVNLGGTLYFAAYDNATGLELWKSDGTEAGTVLVKDVFPGILTLPGGGFLPLSSSPESLTVAGGVLYFVAQDPVSGRELWKTDGTTAGTVRVKDIAPATASSLPGNLVNANGTLYFTADDGTSGRELWTSDGTEAGTVLVHDVNPGAGSSEPADLTLAGGKLFFTAYDGGARRGLWVAETAPAAIPRLANISTRMQVLTGSDVLIGGFIIGGNEPKTVVVRARGPSLTAFGVPGALANPVLQLFAGPTQIAANDDWQQAANLAALQASGLAPSHPLEAAILTTLAPGAYTAIVTGAGLATGVGIIEVFEVDKPAVPLANISTRGQVLTGGDVMIGGFIVQGSEPQTLLVRARGPSLAAFGVPNALADPVLQLMSGQTVIAINDDWQARADAPSIRTRGFAPSDPREAVILVTLPPGAYTAIVTGKNGATGVGIIEVFAQ